MYIYINNTIAANIFLRERWDQNDKNIEAFEKGHLKRVLKKIVL